MSRIAVSIILVVSASLVFQGCAAKVQEQSLALQDGSVVMIEGTTLFRTSTGDQVLQLRYRSAVPIEDTEALRAQAELVWEVFKPKVESRGLHWAALTISNEPKDGPVGARPAYGFVLEKDPAGVWTWVADKKKGSKPDA